MSLTSGFINERSHGGCCCGMTHIYNFGPSFGLKPETELEERVAKTPEELATALKQGCVWPHGKVNDSYPKQTAEARLQEMLSRIEKGVPLPRNKDGSTDYSAAGYAQYRAGRRSGIIEVVLNTQEEPLWRACLERNGFKEVNSHKNSNSRQTLYVFHRNSGA